MVSLRRHFVPNPVPSSETRFALRSKSPLFLHTRYDAAGEETGETQQIAGLTPTITFSDQYTAGNRTQLAASIGGTNDFVNNYQYQSVLGQMSQVTQTGVTGGDAVAAKTVTFAYDRLGEFTSISRYQNPDATANLVAQAAYGYDLNGNLTSLVYSKAGSTLPSYSWTYDSLGNMTSSSETLGSIVDAVSYTSDSTGQLLSATATSGPPSESYSYDSNGNRETVTTTGGQVTCITGPNNELALRRHVLLPVRRGRESGRPLGQQQQRKRVVSRSRTTRTSRSTPGTTATG